MPRKIIFPLLLIGALFLGIVEGLAQPTSVDTVSTVDPTCVTPDGGQITIEVLGGVDPYFGTVFGILDNGSTIAFGFSGALGQTVFTFPDLTLGHPVFSAGSYNFVVGDISGLTTSLLNIQLDLDDPVIAIIAPQPFDYCSVDGPIDLLSVISVDQTGGTFIFSNGPPGSLNGSIFDPLGLSGAVTVDIEYQLGVCNSAFETFTFIISSGSLPDAGADQVICSNDIVNLNGQIIDTPRPIIWTTSGTGTFDDDSDLATIYRPSPADIAAGSLMLSLATNDPDGPGPCGPEVDDLLVTINPEATVTVGPDQTICAGDVVAASGSFGGSATTAFWSTSGSGNFDDNSSLNPIYMPSSGDISAGSVILILTTNDPDTTGPCPPVSDILNVTIDPLAAVAAGPDQTVCAGDLVNLAGGIGGSAGSATWSTSGSGTFNDNTSLSAIYTPSAADLLLGSIDLTLASNDPTGPCPIVADQVTITFNPAATVSISSDKTICAGETANITGAIGGSATSASWTTSGSGSFDDNTSLSAVYTPSAADVVAGTVAVTLTTNDPDGAGPCPSVSENLTITINPTAIANAGNDLVICAGDQIPLTGSIGGPASSATWSSDGTGTFDDPTSLNPVYTPAAADVTLGGLTFVLTTDDPAGPCPAVTDTLMVSFNQPATIVAGSDQTVCQEDPISLSAVLGGSGTSVLWSTNGTGTFDDATKVDAIYTSSQSDRDAGSLILRVIAADPDGNGPCVQVMDSLNISFVAPPTASAGSGATICLGSDVVLNASGGISYNWLPIEGLSNPNIANPIASPDQTTTYTVSVTDSNGCVDTDQVTVDVIITAPPEIDPPIDPFDICIKEAEVFTLTGLGNNIRWYTDSTLTNLIRTGPKLTPTSDELDLTVPGSTSFYATQDIGCGEGPYNSVTINILPEDDPRCNEPCPPVTYDFTRTDIVCKGDSSAAFMLNNITGYSHPLVAYLEVFLNNSSVGVIDTLSQVFSKDSLAPGTYTVSVRQIGGCFNILEETFTISDPANPVTGTIEDNVPASLEEPTGSFTVVIDPTTGIAPYFVRIDLIEAEFPPRDLTIDFTEATLNNGSGSYELSLGNLFAGVYEVTVRDGNGCEDIIRVTVGFEGPIFIPNIFTPNGDQSNQTFFIKNLPPTRTSLVITNRWGKVVYDAVDYKNDWDGGDQPDGTYFYKLFADDQHYKGWVEIWRGNAP